MVRMHAKKLEAYVAKKWKTKMEMSHTPDQTFGKEYKLCSKKIIDELFVDKRSVKSFPYMLFFKPAVLDTPKAFQVVVSVPKRMVRKAHDRNRIKRLTKEVFRKNKLILEDAIPKEAQYAFFLLYNSKDELSYDVLEKKIQTLLQKFVREINPENTLNE